MFRYLTILLSTICCLISWTPPPPPAATEKCCRKQMTLPSRFASCCNTSNHPTTYCLSWFSSLEEGHCNEAELVLPQQIRSHCPLCTAVLNQLDMSQLSTQSPKFSSSMLKSWMIGGITGRPGEVAKSRENPAKTRTVGKYEHKRNHCIQNRGRMWISCSF